MSGLFDSAGTASLVATVHGEPFTELPRDLYIPPDALEVVLTAFQGPLDLLLYLIRKHNLDVLDISMAELTRQYMAYIQVMRSGQFELAAEYLLMAALLIEIKSRMLLPAPVVSDVEEAEDPRAELVRRLLDYEQMKAAAVRLDQLPQAERDFSLVQVWVGQSAARQLPAVSPDDLQNVWLGLLERARANAHHRVVREQLSVRERMSHILRRVHHHEFVEFTMLFDASASVASVIVTFLALLELVREALIEVTQTGNSGTIYVRLATHLPDTVVT
jgi:segregation and condensation protein A